jgi:hypothetical protein
MGNVIKNITGFSGDTNKLSWKEVLILGLVPLGQLWARVHNFKGSLDKWWLMFPLFLFPPFSFLPLILMKFGFVQDGKGADPLDKWILLPIIAKFIIPFILPFIGNSEIIGLVVSILLQLLAIVVSNLTRRYNSCENITVNAVGKSIIDSVTAYGIGNITSFIIPWIPIFGFIVSVIKMVPLIGTLADSLIWNIGFVGAYVLINMFNQQNSISDYCLAKMPTNIKDYSVFGVSLLSIFIL